MLLLQIYNHWLTNIKDWCISRQLWWGHRIPVWYIVGKKCEEDYIVARTEEEALTKAQEKYGKSVEIYQDPDVLDTWFSRSVFVCRTWSNYFSAFSFARILTSIGKVIWIHQNRTFFLRGGGISFICISCNLSRFSLFCSLNNSKDFVNFIF